MCIPDPLKAGPAIILWLLAGVFCSPQTARGQASTCAQEVADIQAYCKKVDRFIKTNPTSRRVFTNTPSTAEQAPESWRQFRIEEHHGRDTRNNLAENASVWLSKGKVVGASFTFQQESRDWVQYAM